MGAEGAPDNYCNHVDDECVVDECVAQRNVLFNSFIKCNHSHSGGQCWFIARSAARDTVTSFDLFIRDLGHEMSTLFVSPSTILKLMYFNWKYFSSVLPNVP